MRTDFSAATEADPDDLFEVIGDLTTYPEWLDVVSAVEPAQQPEAWLVTLRAQVGPFARSKRLRMVRTEHDPAGRTVRFERREIDGRDHSSWTMAATVADMSTGRPEADGSSARPEADGAGTESSKVSLRLDYEGRLWSGLLDGVLSAAAGRATEKLQAHVRPKR